jgi:hypothetical protein
MDSSTLNLEEIMKQIDSLDASEKTKLLKKLLENSTLQINSGFSVSEAKTVFQFNLNSEEQIAGILDIIIDKLYGKLS